MITRTEPKVRYFLLKVSIIGAANTFRSSAVTAKLLETKPTMVALAPMALAYLGIRVFIINWPRLVAILAMRTLMNVAFQTLLGTGTGTWDFIDCYTTFSIKYAPATPVSGGAFIPFFAQTPWRRV